jgi:hypothetical protein
MYKSGKQSAAAMRAAERREREDAAPRLSTEVPALASLRLGVEERSGKVAVSQPKYTRFVVVATAPALFLVPCGDSHCVDGGHDVTRTVMSALRAGRTHFDGEDECRGSVGSAFCNRVLHFEASAEYR